MAVAHYLQLAFKREGAESRKDLENTAFPERNVNIIKASDRLGTRLVQAKL